MDPNDDLWSAKPSTSPPEDDGGSGKKRKLNTGRTSQACTRCRSLKMKCIGATDPPCRRCRRTGATCDFVPRANAARPWSPGPYPAHTCTELWRGDVTSRIKQLEAAQARFEALVSQLQGGGLSDLQDGLKNGTVGLDLHFSPDGSDTHDSQHGSETTDSPPTQSSGVLQAVERLKRELPAHLASNPAWSPAVVGQLWESFRSHMPGLHFFSGQVSFMHPTPLLAVAILYVSAAHYPSADFARHGPVYFQAFTRAMGTLAVPNCPIRGKGSDTDPENKPVSGKFDDVLGIILVGLMAVGWVDTVGMWVNTAYRLLLDGMADERGKRQTEWRGLWEGLRTIELEHSSLHLICPALPASPPDPPFAAPPASPEADKDAGGSIGELLAIMQRRMPRFVGRGLPTVWTTVCETRYPIPPMQISAEPDDMAAIRAWAAEIDAWYSQSAADTSNSSLYVRAIILLNYHLHKLFVLSIFFPLLGVASTSAAEREELLESSRVVLKIEASGFEVWSSWDLVMVTNASLVLLQAWAAGAAGQEDLNLIQNHLNLLTCTQQTAPSLRHTLASRLETSLQQVRTPVRASAKLPISSPTQTTSEIVDHYAQSASVRHGSIDSSQSAPMAPPLYPSPIHPGMNPTMKAPLTRDGDYTRGGYLFMDQAPNMGILTDLPFDVTMGDPNIPISDWPPFLLNLFGDGDPNAQPQPVYVHGQMVNGQVNGHMNGQVH